MSSYNPLVSVIIPVYNGSDYLSKSIDSAINQAYQNIEIIVINDGSCDEEKTEKVALSYGNKIRYFAKENGGVSSALNLGIKKMSGEYFSWLSHDDEYLPNKINAQIKYLKKDYKNNEKIILFSDFKVINDQGEWIGEYIVNYKTIKHNISSVLFGFINGCTTLIPRKCFNEIGLFNENLKSTQDYDFWLRALKKYQFVHIPKQIVKYRVHNHQGTNTINTHYKECNSLFIYFIKTDYINMYSGRIMHLKFAVSLNKRGYFDSFDYCINLYKNNIFDYLLIFFLSKIYVCWDNQLNLYSFFISPIYSIKIYYFKILRHLCKVKKA